MRNNKSKKNRKSRNSNKRHTAPIIKALQEKIEDKPKPEVDEPKTQTENKKPWVSEKLYAFYSIVWVYFIVKIFVVDIETWAFELLGMERFQLFLGLRIFLFPCLIGVFITWKGYRVVLRHIIHFLTVPFYFTVYLFFKSAYYNLVGHQNKRKNATFLVFSLEALGRLIARLNYYLFSLLGVATLIICTFYPNDKAIQYVAFIVSILLAGAVMYQSILKVVHPLKIFGLFKVDDIISFSSNKKLIFSNNTASKPKTRVETIRELLFSQILISVLQANITEVRNKKSFLIVAFSEFFLLILTISAYFTFMNYSLFLIAPHSFGGESNPGFLDFAFYSFYAIPGEGTPIEPISHMSRLIKVFTTFYGYYLFIFLATILLGVFSEKFTKALESLSDFLQQQSKMTEPKLSSMLGISISELKTLSLKNLINLIDFYKDEKTNTSPTNDAG
jgi:hypothetical protein